MFYLHVSLFVFSFQLVRLLSLYLDCQ